MIQISATTMYGGVSHKNPSQKSKVTLLTKHGRHFDELVAARYVEAVKSNTLAQFKSTISVELNEINKKLSRHLRDDDMIKKYKMNDEDTEGWRIFRELSDEYSVLAHFAKK